MKNTFTTRHGAFSVLSNDIAFVEALSQGHILEEELVLEKIIPLIHSPGIILDIGSHIGTHAVLYSKYVANCHVLAFEPQKAIFDLLKENIQNNNIVNITPFHNAVGHKQCICHMSSMLYDGYNKLVNYDTNDVFNYGGIGLGASGETVEMITIDDLKVDNCSLIKIDVEGSEILVLLGAINTIRKYKPIIVFESTDKCVTSEIKQELGISSELESPVSLLTKEGYKCVNLDQNNIIAIKES